MYSIRLCTKKKKKNLVLWRKVSQDNVYILLYLLRIRNREFQNIFVSAIFKCWFFRDDSHSIDGDEEPDFNTLSLHSPPRMDTKERDVAARSDISADSIERNNAGGPGSERFERAQGRWLEDMRARGVKIVQVTYPRTANNDKELSVVRGELLEVSNQL